jgi:hypothetical protein
MSSAMSSRMMPPEVYSAGSDTPSWVKMNFPLTVATTRTAVAMPRADGREKRGKGSKRSPQGRRAEGRRHD